MKSGEDGRGARWCGKEKWGDVGSGGRKQGRGAIGGKGNGREGGIKRREAGTEWGGEGRKREDQRGEEMEAKRGEGRRREGRILKLERKSESDERQGASARGVREKGRRDGRGERNSKQNCFCFCFKKKKTNLKKQEKTRRGRTVNTGA